MELAKIMHGRIFEPISTEAITSDEQFYEHILG